jgi:hypothetical protein
MGSLTTTAPFSETDQEHPVPTFETNQPVVLSIEMSEGAVHVIAGERTDAVVAVNPSDRHRPEDVEAAAQTVVDLADGTLSVMAPRPRGIAAHLGRRRGGSVEVTVELPERSCLRAEAGFADVRCDGRLDDVEVKLGAGNVRLDRTGDLRVRVGAGHVTVEKASGRAEIVTAGEMAIGVVGGDADLKNLNGKTWIGRVAGSVRVRSANGDVTIDAAGSDVTVKTANGDIRLGQVARGSVSIETASGGLEVGVREGTAAWIDAATKFGRVDNDLTAADGHEPTAETLQVRARTQFGDVLIARSSVPTRRGDT